MHAILDENDNNKSLIIIIEKSLMLKKNIKKSSLSNNLAPLLVRMALGWY